MEPTEPKRGRGRPRKNSQSPSVTRRNSTEDLAKPVKIAKASEAFVDVPLATPTDSPQRDEQNDEFLNAKAAEDAYYQKLTEQGLAEEEAQQAQQPKSSPSPRKRRTKKQQQQDESLPLTTNPAHRAKILAIYIGYRKEYGKKIDHEFASDEELAGAPDELIQIDLNMVRKKVNSRVVPNLFKKILVTVCDIFESTTNDLNFETHLGGEGKVSFAEEIKRNADEGYFDSELAQLTIEYGHWLTMSPEIRLLVKVGTIAQQVIGDNKSLQRPQPKPVPNVSKVAERFGI